MPSLRDRLERIRSLGLVRAADCPAPLPGGEKPASGAAASNTTAFPGTAASGVAVPGGSLPGEDRQLPIAPGWSQAAPWLWTREVLRPASFPETVDLSAFILASSRRKPASSAPAAGTATAAPAAPTVSAAAVAADCPGLTVEDVRQSWSSSTLRFFDLETSGLSGGTGTVAFLAGIGSLKDDVLAVRQYFLSDYPGESAFVDAILAQFDAGCTVVSYNGRSFDMPLLRTRCIMNGIRLPELGHVDALHLSRRLWKRLYGSASLQHLERELLEIDRGPDVPGSRIPGLWLDWLRSGTIAPMEAVFSHNVQDIVTLARLTKRAAAIVAEPLRMVRDSDSSLIADPFRLGRTLFELGRRDEGEPLLLAACADGDELSGLWLLSCYKREGRLDELGALFEALPHTLHCEIERAKYAEHRLGDLAQALVCTENALVLAGRGYNVAFLAALDARKLRLLAKLRKRQDMQRSETGMGEG